MGARYLGLIGAYMSANVQALMEHRASFLTQLFATILENGIWILFWQVYLARFPAIDGWGLHEILVMWSVVTVGFGLGNAFCANMWTLPRTILMGGLDHFLLLPKPVLVNVLFSRMGMNAWADIFFGLCLFILGGRPGVTESLLFLYFALLVGVLFVSYSVLLSAASFFLNNSERITWEGLRAFIHFSTYPTTMFPRAIRVILFSVVPAGFVAYVPAMAIKSHAWPLVFGCTGVVALFAVAAVALFHVGLSRYESGNMGA